MALFLTGCTHFGHARIIELARRPFASVEAMDEALVAAWNARVGPRDTVWHLGDVAWRGAGEAWLGRLNGTVERIQGNHDPEGWGRDLVTLRHEGRKVVLCHYPIEEWDGWWRGAVHFHAHTHAPAFRSAPRRGNVGVDATGFAPIPLDEAVARLLAEAP